MATSVDQISKSLSTLGLQDLPVFREADIHHNPVDVYRSYISSELSKINGVDVSLIYPALETSISKDSADLNLPVPRLRVKGKPQELAQKWAEAFPKDLVEVTANGIFLRFNFNGPSLTKLILPIIWEQRENYGRNESGSGKVAVIEFSSPNIAKPFHAGHLRSTIIGSFLANLHESQGWKVHRVNYLGDWGKQFGLLAIGYKKYGDEDQLKSNPIRHLYDVYVKVNADATEEDEKIQKDKAEAESKGLPYTPPLSLHDKAREFFKRMEDGDEESLKVWARFRDLSITKLKDTYDRLNIHYDEYDGESQVSLELMNKMVDELRSLNLIEEDGGALLIDLSKHDKKLGKAIVQKRDGTTLYLTRDIGTAYKRYEKYKFDKSIYVVSSQQDMYFSQLFKIFELMGFDWAKKCVHINYGLVQGMSTRKGKAVFLDDIMEVAKEEMHKVMQKNEEKYAQVENPEEVADIVGKTAIRIQDSTGKRINNYAFDWSRMTSFEGDTGPYLQYAHSRLSSVRRNVNYTDEEIMGANLELLTEPDAYDLVRLLGQYPDVLKNAFRFQETSTVVTYLFKLTHAVSKLYDILWVRGRERDIQLARLALFGAAKQVLNNGMTLLGLTPLERM
ncbi:mitochondrial and cytoplasmic arginine-tRNA ligase Rrs1/Mrs1 [Schizosaccharomyces pombe]|uniref:Probable arginine--tRNA ligase, cytoplasmic n=1 Tax=Schizosaccharomyces pombe (strain 972 / ATCC 24843) TaxID=284812 RepID=SYRC_SCHPO|nr:putative arginine--tRNA (Arg) ligase Rrs1/Mrs1 [Schizosaccharomyces pombe]O74781.1 RecName: Full=Probable arginine--tRNA ligase, cytoplasmic; AltName: Full=Arginyl-tRNA synthetase; Short=ArgRS [Schizosaccharomyces pombe 972h-]CAA21267.1 mitochondrial and cytoplasmic arginine-tRNA ligase Rrs1/Mrs1 (predicted) [Schizosaccharomyces pombe]|eukprot:NP_596077.1 putative arginine--tRNA (Arg) ligase Rrs1/Mrs1 [Schizosaccharomyces pombe]